MKQKLLQHPYFRGFLLATLLLIGGGIFNDAWADKKTETFESATTSTTYNSTTTITEAKSSCSIGWSIYYGSASTTSAITGSNSCLIRYYTSDAKLGYAKTTTGIKGLSNVTFNAKVTNTGNKMGVWYSTDGSTWTALATDVTLTTSSSSKSYDIPNSSSSTTYYVKIGLTTGSTTNKKDLIIDDVAFTYSSTPQSTAPTIGGDATYTISQDVPLTSVDGARIYYTTDGTNPTTSTPTYVTSGETVTITSSCTIKAASKEDGKDLSSVSNKTFTKSLAVNSITVTDGNTHNIALTGVGAVTEHTLAATATSGGTVTYAVKSATNLTEGTDFTFNTSTRKLSFTNTYKGIIVITASVAADADYAAASQDITINCSGDKRNPVIAYDGEDTELSSDGFMEIDTDLIETDGTITVTSGTTSVATVSEYTISPVAAGTTTITITTAAGTYYNSGSGSFELTVVTPEDCDIALTGAPVAKTFDLYNNATPQVIEYTTSSAGAVSIAANSYATFSIDQVNKKITITPKAKTPSAQTITINQAAAGKYLAGSTTFSLTVNNSATSETYEKVTDAGTLNSGDVVTFVNETAENALGAFKTTNYNVADISSTYESNAFTLSTSQTAVTLLTLVSTTATVNKETVEAWKFKIGSDDYLYASSSSSNELKHNTSSTVGENGKATISITSGNANIIFRGSNTRNKIQYNNSSTLFSCYSSAQDAIQLYKRAKYPNTITVTNGTAQTLTLEEATSLTLSATSYCGAVSFAYKSASGLTKDTDFTFESETGELVVDENAASGTVTITASTVESATHKPASVDIVITVVGKSKSDVEFALSNQTKPSGSTFTLVNGEDFETDGTVTLESSNTNVATVEGLTVTAVGVGSTTITVSCAEGTLYNAGEDDFTFTVTAPAGVTTVSDIVLFNETFASTSGPYQEDNFSGSSAYSVTPDETGWTFTQENGGNKCAKFGSSGSAGSAQTRSITVTSGKSYKLSFKCAPWNDGTDGVKVTVTNGTINSKASVTTGALTSGKWNSKEYTIVATSSSISIKFEKGGTENRFFLDDIKITTPPTATVNINKYGFATYCSEKPIDFSSTDGYTAWRVSDIASNGTITFTKITEKIKGGQGVLLYNKDADEVNTSNVTINFADGTTEFTSSENMLVGTTAPVYIDEVAKIYGLSGSSFVKNNALGNIGANKAYILASSIPAEVKNFTFVFEDETTGITETRQATREEVEAIFNLSGQKLNKMQRGINIVNGKKVIIK